MEYTSEEIPDYTRDLIALIRAHFDGDMAGSEAILGNVGERGLRAIAEGLTGMVLEFLCRLALASGLIEDDEQRRFLFRVDTAEITAMPELRELIEQNIAAYQARYVGGG